LRGQSIVAPDATTLAGFAAVLLGAGAGAVLVVRRRRA
jgi:hypothetical protein